MRLKILWCRLMIAFYGGIAKVSKKMALLAKRN